MSSFKSNLQTSLPYGHALAQKGVRLYLHANSDFVPLVRSATPVLQGNAVTDEDLLIAGERATESSTAILSEFDAIKGAMRSNLADLVRNHLRDVRAIAAKSVALMDKVQTYLSNTPDTSAVGRFNVICDPLPEFLETHGVAELLEQSVSKPTNRLPSMLTGHAQTEEVLMAMVIKEAGDVSAEITRDISLFGLNTKGQPRKFLEDVYCGFFCGMESMAENYNFNDWTKLPAGEQATVAYVVYLLANHLLKNTPNDAEGSLSTFNNGCMAVAAHAHHMLVDAWNVKKNAIQNGILILIPNYTTTSIVVDKTVYDSFLNAGGRPEIILGAKVGMIPVFSAQDVAERSDECVRVWNQFVLLNNATADNEARDFLRGLYKVVWSEDANAMLEFEKTYRTENQNFFQEVTNLAYDFINNAPVEKLRDPAYMVETLIAKFRYSYTPACIFLAEIRKARENAVTNSDSLENAAREDALVATIKYLVAYVMTQIGVMHV